MDKKRIVIKVGTSSLTYDTGKINIRQIELLAQVISDLCHSGCEVALVTSGAIAVGVSKLGFKERPKSTPEKQAASAVGQSELMSLYEKFFAEYGKDVAQLLLTKNILDNNERKENAINAFNTLFSWGVVPIINENDVISTAEIKFGDNDTLSDVVAELIEADLLILLSDIDGLYNKNPVEYPDAQLVREVSEITDEVMASAGGEGTTRGTGGMVTKLIAAKNAMSAGIEMVIANGKNPKIIYDILENRAVCTRFKPKK